MYYIVLKEYIKCNNCKKLFSTTKGLHSHQRKKHINKMSIKYIIN